MALIHLLVISIGRRRRLLNSSWRTQTNDTTNATQHNKKREHADFQIVYFMMCQVKCHNVETPKDLRTKNKKGGRKHLLLF